MLVGLRFGGITHIRHYSIYYSFFPNKDIFKSLIYATFLKHADFNESDVLLANKI